MVVLQVAGLSQQLTAEQDRSRNLSHKVSLLEKAVAELSAQEAASGNELRAQSGAAEARAR